MSGFDYREHNLVMGFLQRWKHFGFRRAWKQLLREFGCWLWDSHRLTELSRDFLYDADGTQREVETQSCLCGYNTTYTYVDTGDPVPDGAWAVNVLYQMKLSRKAFDSLPKQPWTSESS
jgi:hypothetical protein